MRTVITKCYLVQVVDGNGYEVKSEYFFGTRPEAEAVAKQLKAEAEEIVKAITEATGEDDPVVVW